MIEIVINPDYCKGCDICVVSCPKKVLGSSTRINSKGYTLPEAINLEACTLCKMCEVVCPDLAIAVTGERENRRKQ